VRRSSSLKTPAQRPSGHARSQIAEYHVYDGEINGAFPICHTQLLDVVQGPRLGHAADHLGT
jgi:hypothetical protein